MNKQAFEVSPALLRLALGIPVGAVGGLMGYMTAPKHSKLEGAARGAGIGYMAGTGIGLGSHLGEMLSTQQGGTNQLPYMLAGGLGGGALGFGVGKVMQGVPGWEQKRRFREELMSLLKEEHNKLRSELKQVKTGAGSVVKGLITAKSLSDRRDYSNKHKVLRQLIERNPDDFIIDSENNGIVGLTWVPGNFRIHAPINILPASFRSTTNVGSPSPR